MATPTNTVNVLNESVRESLANIISNVNPTDTPLFSMLPRTKAKAFREEWLVDEYNGRETTARPYGDDYSSESRRSPERRQNVVQTVWRSFTIGDEEESITHAGFKSRMALEIMKVGVETKIDLETILFKLNQGSDIPTSGNNVTGKCASLLAFFETNVQNIGTGGSNGGWDSTSKEYDARTDAAAANQTAFTETHLRDVLDSIWQNSGDISDLKVFCNIKQKNKFNNFDGLADQRIMNTPHKQAAIIGAADIYRSNHGYIKVMLDRWMRDQDVFLVRPKRMKLASLWMFRPRKLAVSGNNRKWGISSSFTLCVKNEKEHGLVADCN